MHKDASAKSYQRSNIFSTMESKKIILQQRKNKTANFLQFALTIAPFISVVVWVIFVSVTWDPSQGIKFDSASDTVILVVLVSTMALIPVLAFLAFWSEIEPSQTRLARKVFSKQTIEDSSHEILFSYSLADKQIQEIFRSKLGVTGREFEYMQTLAAEGYKGVLKDLVSIVRKL